MCKKIFLLGACLTLILGGCVVNPLTGEEEFMLFPKEHDVAIGKKYAPEVEKQLGGRIANVSIQNYIQSVGDRVAKVSHNPDIEYHFVAVNDESVNAVTLPGGYIFITKGMLKKLENEAQLGGVLAHEIAHVVARDSMNVMSNNIGIKVLLSAVMSSETSRSVVTTADITRQILGLRYSRSDERTADMGGLDYTYKAGYDPRGMVETMDILAAESKVRTIEFFSTHPDPANRSEYLREEIEYRYFNLSGMEVNKDDYNRIVIDQLK